MRRRMNWAKIDPLLGTMTDTELSQRFSCGITTIFQRRRALGIPVYPYSNPIIPADQMIGAEYWSCYRQLGTQKAVAARYGVTAKAVSIGIARWRRRRRDELRAQAAA